MAGLQPCLKNLGFNFVVIMEKRYILELFVKEMWVYTCKTITFVEYENHKVLVLIQLNKK